MRHRIKSYHFNRDTNERKALLKNLVINFLTRGAIMTSKSRASEVKRLTDKLLFKAQTNSLSVRQQIHRFFGTRQMVNLLVDKLAPAQKGKTAGFSRLSQVGPRRGDNTNLVKLELISQGNNEAKKPEAKKVESKK